MIKKAPELQRNNNDQSIVFLFFSLCCQKNSDYCNPAISATTDIGNEGEQMIQKSFSNAQMRFYWWNGSNKVIQGQESNIFLEFS